MGSQTSLAFAVPPPEAKALLRFSPVQVAYSHQSSAKRRLVKSMQETLTDLKRKLIGNDRDKIKLTVQRGNRIIIKLRGREQNCVLFLLCLVIINMTAESRYAWYSVNSLLDYRLVRVILGFSLNRDKLLRQTVPSALMALRHAQI